MTQTKTPTELGTKPVGQLLMQYAIPAIIAMCVASMYNIIDSVYIGQWMGPYAISGLALTMPIMNLSAAFGTLVGMGSATLLSVKLGQKDYETARLILGNNIIMNCIIGISYSIVMLLFMTPVLYFFGASDHTLPYARDYILIILIGNVISQSFFGQNAICRAAGFPKQAMTAVIISVILNIVLAPLFIYYLNWGMEGAALATVLSQAVALCRQLLLFSRKDRMLRYERSIFRFDKKIVKNCMAIGLAPFLMNLCACVVVIIVNRSFYTYGGDLSVGAFGIVYRVLFVFIMIVMGINQGMQPIAGYNYGAQQFDRVRKVLKLALFFAVCVTTTGFLVGEFLPQYIVQAFTRDAGLIELSKKGMRLMMIAFPIVGIQMVCTNFFFCIGLAKKSIFLSLTRQLLFVIPALLILPPIFGTTGVWISFPCADVVAAVVAVLMTLREMKRFRRREVAMRQEPVNENQFKLL